MKLLQKCLGHLGRRSFAASREATIPSRKTKSGRDSTVRYVSRCRCPALTAKRPRTDRPLPPSAELNRDGKERLRGATCLGRNWIPSRFEYSPDRPFRSP